MNFGTKNELLGQCANRRKLFLLRVLLLWHFSNLEINCLHFFGEEEDGEVQIAYFEGGNFQKFIHHERIFYRKFNHRRSEDLWLILEFSCATIGPWNILIDFFLLHLFEGQLLGLWGTFCTRSAPSINAWLLTKTVNEK